MQSVTYVDGRKTHAHTHTQIRAHENTHTHTHRKRRRMKQSPLCATFFSLRLLRNHTHAPGHKWTEQSGQPSHRVRTDHRSHSPARPLFDFSLGEAAQSASLCECGGGEERAAALQWRTSGGRLHRNRFFG